MNEEKCLLCVFHDNECRCQMPFIVYGEDWGKRTENDSMCEMFTRAIDEGVHTLAIRPSYTIADLMVVKKLRLRDVDRDIADVLLGKKAVDEAIAEKLRQKFGLTPLFWLRLQKNYEERLKKVKKENGEVDGTA